MKEMNSQSVEAKTAGGLWLTATADMVMPNVAKVAAVADEGCGKAEVGEYVICQSFASDERPWTKPMPIQRDYFDDASGLYVIHDEHILGVIPEAQEEDGQSED